MKRTKQVTPKIQLKAEQYINLGYQRLLTFEVPGGGFDWYGGSPANIILSAWGLLQFHDMTKVYDIDKRIITRTKKYLLKNQQHEGCWDLKVAESKRGSYTWGKVKSKLPVTAYVAWTLAEAGQRGPKIKKAINYIKQHLRKTDDPYILALAANAMAKYNPKDPFVSRLLKRLDAMKVESKDGKTVFWKAQSQTMYYGAGKTGSIETTALSLLALMNNPSYSNTVNRGLIYLVKSKDPHGTWYSTQATILAMKALLGASTRKQSKKTNHVAITYNGKEVKSLSITPEQSDVLQYVDLKQFTKKGVQKIGIQTNDKNSNLMYQVVGRFYVPWNMLRKIDPKSGPNKKPLGINLKYDRTNLKKNDVVTVNGQVEYFGEKPTFMVIVDLGIPPGFTVLPAGLVKLREKGLIDKFTMTGRQITIYLGRMEANKPFDFSYRLKAKYPIKAKTPRSMAYEYYNPDKKAFAAPVTIVVK